MDPIDTFRLMFDEHRKHMDERMDRLEQMLSEYIERGNQSVNSIVKIQERQTSCDKEWNRNWKQHDEFFKEINNLQSIADKNKGATELISKILIPVAIGTIIAIIRAFIQ